MAEIIDTLKLDIDQALRDVNQLENALDRALTDVELKVDTRQVEQAEDVLREIERIAGRAATETQSMALAAGDAEVNFEDVARALNVSEDEARRLAGEILTAQAASNRLEDSSRDIARQMGLSEDETRRFVQQMQRADKEADEVARSTDRIRGGLGNLLSGLGLAAGIGAAVRLAGQARDAFAALQDSVNAVKVVFGEAAAPVLAFSNTVAQTAGLSMAQFNQAASVLGSSLINVGFGFDEAAAKTIDLTQRAADMASIFGGEVSVAVEAILSALRGEGNPIERFGVTLTEAKVQAEAAALGFSKIGGEFDSTAKAAARLSIIMRETERTAGDFANTSGDLANAQKIASAEFENARAALGEALLPVFQALLDAGPEVLQAIEDLAPALSSLATSAGNLATSTPGVLDFVDALHLLTDIPRGFGQLGETFQLNAGLVGGFFDSLEEVSRLDFSNLGDNFEGVGDSIQRTLERIDTQGLIDDLREGGDAAGVLASRLADVGRKGKLDPRFIADLSKIAGVDLETNVAVLVNLITNAERLKFAADDVTALRIALALLSDQGAPSGPIRSLNDRIREIPEATADAATGFDTIQRAADEAGVTLNEFVLSADPVAQALLDTIPPSTELGLTLEAIGSSVSVAAEFLTNTLRPALVNAGDALEDLNDDGKTTATEFTANLQNMAAATLEFKANLATIAAISPELAASLAALPEDVAAGILEGFVADPAKILAAEQALLGTPAQISATIREVVGAAMSLAASNPNAEQVAKFTALVTTLDIPGATAAITPILQGVLDVSFADLEPPDLTDQVVISIEGWDAVEIAAATERVLNTATQDIEIDLTGVGILAGETFTHGMQEAIAAQADEIENTILGTMDTAIQRDSPPKLFLDLGEESGDAFWAGFNQADLTLKTATPDLKGSIVTGSPTSGGSGVNVEVNINNPSMNDVVSDTARVAQITSSIAASYRSVVPNGM